MSTLTITHSHEEGTLIDGTSRGDGSAEVLKSQGWRWGRSISSWYLPHSRDRLPKRFNIDRTKSALETAGFAVDLELDTGIRPTEEVEAGKVARQEDRVEALVAKADRKFAAADAAAERAGRDHQALPPGGEPIKVGHHSEGRHRRALERADNSMRRSIDANDVAEVAASRADAAARTTEGRYSPVTVANRIKRFRADARRLERQMVADVYDAEKGYRPATAVEVESRRGRFASRAAELADQISFWEGVRTEQIASGQITQYGPETVSKGDRVKIRGHWWVVARANKVTVSVVAPGGYSSRSEYSGITDHRAADAPELVTSASK